MDRSLTIECVQTRVRANGRRHPVIYLTTIAAAISTFLLFFPLPFLEKTGLFWNLLIFSSLMQSSLTILGIQQRALSLEISLDYHERTSILNFQMAIGGLASILAMLAFSWLHGQVKDPFSTTTFSYSMLALSASFATSCVLGFGLAGALATRRYIPQLHQPPIRTGTRRAEFSTFRKTLFSSQVLTLLPIYLLISFVPLLGTSITLYVNRFHWELGPSNYVVFLFAGLLAFVAAFPTVTSISRRLEKKAAVRVGLSCSLFAALIPFGLAATGLKSLPGEHTLISVLAVVNFLSTLFALVAGVFLSSMVGDTIDASKLAVGRHLQASILSLLQFVGRFANGLALMVTGILLPVFKMPNRPSLDNIPPGTFEAVSMVYVLLSTILTGLAIWALRFYKIDQKTHQTNLEKLAATDQVNPSLSN